RRHDGNDSLVQQRLEQVDVDALNLAGEQMVDALNDPQRMRDDGVGARGAKVVGGEALEDFVREPVGGVHRELQRVGVGDAGAVEVRGPDALLFAERLDLDGRAVDEHDADVERTQHGDVEENV